MPSCNDLSEIGIEGVSPVVQKNFPLTSHSKFREFRISFCVAKFFGSVFARYYGRPFGKNNKNRNKIKMKERRDSYTHWEYQWTVFWRVPTRAVDLWADEIFAKYSRMSLLALSSFPCLSVFGPATDAATLRFSIMAHPETWTARLCKGFMRQQKFREITCWKLWCTRLKHHYFCTAAKLAAERKKKWFDTNFGQIGPETFLKWHFCAQKGLEYTC